jgi:hypothetical protein
VKTNTTRRIEQVNARSIGLSADDDHLVLRLSREALKTDRPEVRFIGRLGGAESQRRLQWPA